MVKLTMEPVTRIEGHAKITVQLDDDGNVVDTRLHVMEFRGFEKFLQGRPVEELARIVPRICGICDVQHHLAAAKAVDQIFGFEDEKILPTAYKMREIMNWGSFMHSHALHFYFLAAPDLIIPDGTRKTRNVFQIIKDQPEIALQAIELRRNGLEIVRKIGGRPIHPTSSTPGGISTELDDETQKDLLQRAQRNVELAQATLDLAKPIFEEKMDLVKSLGYFGDTRHCGLVNDGVWDVYNGDVRIKDVDGSIYTEYKNLEYKDVVAEHVKPYSWLKFPYIKELGYPEGIYRVAPLSRINVADKMPDAAPLAQAAFEEFHDKFGYAQAPLLFHWARLIELLASAECAADALDQDLSGPKFPEELERTAGEGAGQSRPVRIAGRSRPAGQCAGRLRSCGPGTDPGSTNPAHRRYPHHRSHFVRVCSGTAGQWGCFHPLPDGSKNAKTREKRKKFIDSVLQSGKSTRIIENV